MELAEGEIGYRLLLRRARALTALVEVLACNSTHPLAAEVLGCATIASRLSQPFDPTEPVKFEEMTAAANRMEGVFDRLKKHFVELSEIWPDQPNRWGLLKHVSFEIDSKDFEEECVFWAT